MTDLQKSQSAPAALPAPGSAKDAPGRFDADPHTALKAQDRSWRTVSDPLEAMENDLSLFGKTARCKAVTLLRHLQSANIHWRSSTTVFRRNPGSGGVAQVAGL